MISESKKQEILEYIQNRIMYALEWYKDCIACEETYRNIKADIASILKETEEKFDLRPIPNHFSIDLDPETKELVIKYTKEWNLS